MSNNKRVLLFSGGMDSYIAAHVWEPDELLYCALGHRYQQQELGAVARSGLRVTIDRRLSLADLERDDGIIPLRNLYLLSIASHYGTTVGLAALSGEVNPDKSQRFRRKLQTLLNVCYAASYWSSGDKVSVVYPVGQHTKRELIALYLRTGGDWKDLIERTRSCYATTPKPCGVCSACVKRYIAMALNGIDEPTENDVRESEYLQEMVARWPTYNRKRRLEIRTVFPDILK